MSDTLNIKSELIKLLNKEYQPYSRGINPNLFQIPTVSNTTLNLTKSNTSNKIYFKLNNGVNGNIKINLANLNTTNRKVYDLNGLEVVNLSSGHYEIIVGETYFILVNRLGLTLDEILKYDIIGETLKELQLNNETSVTPGSGSLITKNSVTEDKLSPDVRNKLNNRIASVEDNSISESKLTSEVRNKLNSSNSSISDNSITESKLTSEVRNKLNNISLGISDNSITENKLDTSIINKLKSINPNVKVVTSEGMIANDVSKVVNNTNILRGLLTDNSINEISIPSGTFYINRISAKITNKIIKGIPGKTILETSGIEALFIDDSSNVTFEGITFKSTNSSTDNGVITSNNCEINNIKFLNCKFNTSANNGIKFVNEGLKFTKDITFEKCEFLNIGRMGAEIQNHNETPIVNRYENIKFIQCSFKNIGTTGSNGMAISMSGYGTRVLVSDCAFEKCKNIGVELIGTSKSIVEKCTFIGDLTSGTSDRYNPISITNFRPFENIIVRDNMSIGSLDNINIYNGKNLIFENNQLEAITSLYLRDVTDSKITKNNIKSIGNYSIMLDNCLNNEIYNNTLDSRNSTTNYSVLRLYGANSTKNRIYENQIYKPSGGGHQDSINGASGNYIGVNYLDNNRVDSSENSNGSISNDSITEDKLSPIFRNKVNKINSDLTELTNVVNNIELTGGIESSEVIVPRTVTQSQLYNIMTTSSSSIRFSPGTYILNGNSLPNKKIRINNPIKLSGENVTIVLEGGSQLIIDAPNVTMDGLNILVRNHGTLMGGESTITVSKNKFTINNCNLEGTSYYHGIFIEDRVIGNCDDIVITNCNFKKFGYGILKQYAGVCTAHRLYIDNCTFTEILRGDAIELNLRYDVGYIISNNYIDGVSGGDIINGGMGIGIAGGAYGGDKLDQTRDGLIFNNVVKNVERCAIHLEACNRFTITDNRLENNGTGNGLEIYGSTDNMMHDNYIDGFTRGIYDDIGALSNAYIASTDNNVIKNNFVNNCNIGVHVGASGEKMTQYVLSNVIKNCNTGIFIQGKAVFDISDNILENCKIPMNLNYEVQGKSALFPNKYRFIKMNNNVTSINGLSCDNFNSIISLTNYDKFEFENNNFKLGNFVRKPSVFNSSDEPLYYVKGDELTTFNNNNTESKQLVTANGFRAKTNTTYYYTATVGNDYIRVNSPGDPKSKFTIGQTIDLIGAGTNGATLKVVILEMYVQSSEYRIRISDTIKTTVSSLTAFNVSELATFKNITNVNASDLTSINNQLSQLSGQIGSSNGSVEVVLEVGSGRTFSTVTSAINSISDNSKNKRYKIKVYNGTYNERIILKAYVGVEGINPNTVIFEMDRPNTTPNNNVSDQSMVELHNDGSYIRNITVKGKNFRYMVHSEFNGNSDITIDIDNCYIQHKGNDSNYTWQLPHALGAGTGASNTVMNLTNSTFIGASNGRGVLIHDAVNPTSPSTVNITGCKILTDGGNIYEGLNLDNYAPNTGSMPWYINLNNNVIQIGVAVTGTIYRTVLRGGGNSMSRLYSSDWVDSDSGLYLKNTSNATIIRGSAVAISVDERVFTGVFNGTSYNSYSRFAGFAIADIPPGEFGWTVMKGTVQALFGEDVSYTNRVMIGSDGKLINYNMNTANRRLPIGELVQPSASNDQLRRVLLNETNLKSNIADNVITRSNIMVEYAWGGTPLNAPQFKGQLARDTVNNKVHMGIGTGVSDWIALN